MSVAISAALNAFDPARTDYATSFVDRLLTVAREAGASDVHLRPVPEGLALQWRLDGVLVSLGTFPAGASANIVARLKVLAELLTYRNDLPQEGRIRLPQPGVEMRLSTFPTVYGEKAVIRLFRSGSEYLRLADLELPNDVETTLGRLLAETSGAVLVTGPAGSGKTTTLYACLREIVAASASARSMVSLEDPVEVVIPGVAQSQVNPAAGFDLATGLRSVLRQDPEVILVGEIRDRETAQTALEASLTGQLVLSSFHAGSAAVAINRLTDMGIEPYVVRSGIMAVISQRLLRRLCSCCVPTDELLGLPVRQARRAVGCGDCGNTGYRGRFVLAELLDLRDPALARAILDCADAASLERAAVATGMINLWQHAIAAVESGRTSPAEVRRVFGLGDAT